MSHNQPSTRPARARVQDEPLDDLRLTLAPPVIGPQVIGPPGGSRVRLARGEIPITLSRAHDLRTAERPITRSVELLIRPSTGGMPVLAESRKAAEYLIQQEAAALDDPREYSWVLALTTKNRLLCPPYLLSIGSTDRCVMDPAGILRFALAACATGIILAHTHPSGSVIASPDDVQVTQRIKAACDLLGISLLDHLILAGCHRTKDDPPWLSLRQVGVL